MCCVGGTIIPHGKHVGIYHVTDVNERTTLYSFFKVQKSGKVILNNEETYTLHYTTHTPHAHCIVSVTCRIASMPTLGQNNNSRETERCSTPCNLHCKHALDLPHLPYYHHHCHRRRRHWPHTLSDTRG